MEPFICPRCHVVIAPESFDAAHRVCGTCGYHARLGWKERLACTVDPGSFTELDPGLDSTNPIEFPGYEEKIAAQQKELGMTDSVVTGKAAIMGKAVIIGIMDSRFIMGSMGSAAGEKITRAFEKAEELRLPVILFTASGGARMQEGIFSLMQMAKTSGAVSRHNAMGLLYISVLTDPTTGGVTASFASLGDIIIAEPGALVGFAGKRVIQDTVGSTLPQDFQTAEFVCQRGFADLVIARKELRMVLGRLLGLHGNVSGGEVPAKDADATKDVIPLPLKSRLELLHSLSRPSTLDYLPLIFRDFTELHGDRCYGDDPAISGGIGFLGDIPVTVIAQVRGRTIEEFKERNFSMPHPEGFRKALRLAKQAERFGRPVICFIDTPGAFCGAGAEERGQGEAIARNLLEFISLSVPVISVILGEGGSGGALALAVCDRLAMLENAVYSVISSRGFASILWKDPGREYEAAALMKITAEDLKGFGICDEIIEESAGGAHRDIPRTAVNIAAFLLRTTRELLAKDRAALLEERRGKFRAAGKWRS